MSLTNTAFYSRRAVNWAILAVVGYILLRIFWGILTTLIILIFPPKAPPPNHAFGKLPSISFPKQASYSGELRFELQTISGEIPATVSSAPVFFMPKAAPTLLALTRAGDFATTLTFDPAPVQESKTIYRFNDAAFPLRRLRYDIVSNNFIVRYAFEQDPSVFIDRNLPTPDGAILEATNMLENFSLFNDDISGGTTKVTFWKLHGAELLATQSLSSADAVRIDFFRKVVFDTPVYTPDPNTAPVSILLSGSTNTKKRVLQLAYTYWPIDYETSATYGLKTSEQAWVELQNGAGYIARKSTSGNTVVIRNVYVGYYDSFEPQTYLQPIFVFEGDGGFLAYVPAVSAPWAE